MEDLKERHFAKYLLQVLNNTLDEYGVKNKILT